MHFSLLMRVRQLRGRHAFLIVWAALLLAAPSRPGCEQNYDDGRRDCCEPSVFRGCCLDEPLRAGGWYSPRDPGACGEPTRSIPACGQFPVSERLDEEGCRSLFEDTRAEPCVCTPLEEGCKPICVVPEPPSLPDACAGVPLVSENPASCPATGVVVTYTVTRIAADPNSASGFDLDGTDGSSCREGARTVPDGPGGVDNSLASVDPTLLLNLTVLNRELFNRACEGALTTSFQVDANVEQACATVTVLDSGEFVSSSALQLTDSCLQGTLARFPLPLADKQTPIENVRLSATLDATGFANMTLGATAAAFTSEFIFEILGDTIAWLLYVDIRADLDLTGALQCDAISLTLELGGVVE